MWKRLQDDQDRLQGEWKRLQDEQNRLQGVCADSRLGIDFPALLVGT